MTPTDDDVTQKKVDNGRNDSGEDAAWDAGLIPADFKRVFVKRDELICILTRREDSQSSKENWWTIESHVVADFHDRVRHGCRIQIVFVDEHYRAVGRFDWTDCLPMRNGKWHVVQPPTRRV